MPPASSPPSPVPAEAILGAVPYALAFVGEDERRGAGFANRAAAELLGVAEGGVAASVLAERIGALRAAVAETVDVEEGGALWVFQEPAPRLLRVTSRPVLPPSRDGGVPAAPLGRVWTFYDLTTELLAAHAAADAMGRAGGDFLARMHHDLRTPLTAIVGFSRLLLRDPPAGLGTTERSHLARVERNAQRLTALMERVLDLARAGAGRLRVDRLPVALDDLVSDATALYEGRAQAKGLALRAEVPPGLAPVEADPARLEQVLTTLVENAVQYTERGAVAVRVHAATDGRTPLALEVADTGPGLPPERLASVLDAAAQAESSTARADGGTGLSLALARVLCELMGATLSAESEVGAGSTFRVTFGRLA